MLGLEGWVFAGDLRLGTLPWGSMSHEVYMERALEEARVAESLGEVPVGAVIVHEGIVVARGGNRRESSLDPLAHAEVIALREAARALGRWRLFGCSLYVTLEPCAMCAGAAVLARIDGLVFGATDPKVGAAGSIYDIPRDDRLNHRMEVTGGVLAGDCSALLSRFFKERRKKA